MLVLHVATSVNPITHQDYNGVGQPNQYYQNEAPPPPAQMPSQDYGRRDQPRGTRIIHVDVIHLI